MKIHAGKDPGFSSLAVGCCDDPIDTFFVGTLFNPRGGGSVQVYQGTADPDKATTDERQFQNQLETVLRSSPTIDDSFDIEESKHQDHAVFGNILSKYREGAKGRVVLTQRDKIQRLWAYVVMSQESDFLRYHIAYPANAGWILMTSSAPKKQ